MPRQSEALASSIIHLLNVKMAKLQDVWDAIGIQEAKRLERMGSVKIHIEMLLNEMIHEEELLNDQLNEAIHNWQEKLQALCSELLLDLYKADKNSTPLQLEKELRDEVTTLLKERIFRMEQCEILLKEDQALCNDLCKTPYYIPTGKVPSLQEIEELKNHIISAAKEKEHRLATFLGLRHEITNLMANIEHVPDTTFEKDAVLEQEDLFFLSDENIKSLEVLRQQLVKRKEELVTMQESLKEQIHSLWITLQIPTEQQNMETTGPICEVNAVLQQNLEQLQQMKIKNIKEVITGIREKVHTYWDKCLYSQKQREESDFLRSENFTEELLRVHDEELLKITLYYEKYQELFDNFEKWERWWKLFLEFEKKASDPNRYANRGGTLLKEEKERTQLQKKLPKLEEELKLNILKWETEQSGPFMINGQKPMIYITTQWEQHRFKKEQEKQERCIKKDDAPVCRTPLKRPLCPSNTPLSKIRKLNGTSTIISSGSACNRVVKTPRKTPNAGKLPDPLQRPSLQDKKTIDTSIPNVARQPGTFNALVTSYSEFSRDLSRKSNCVKGQLNSTTLENP
ncbi:protein regulator of cytokinesis 1-like isoform X1 [Amblyraja radiata]|uniref:protein regulator of cytokinesis 1-like isoform X1 n=1 Tax=Amblyraja radiata TaxID=386614 RepID=UPI00140241D5|nr:protein regulator of cytokinesis 1-like isoform X1 [Amblyraja radiata]